MHELHATQAVLDTAIRHASGTDAQAVTDVYIVIGKLSTMHEDSVRFYWENLSQGTLCEAARLHFRVVFGRGVCAQCAQIFEPVDLPAACPSCGSMQVEILEGCEFYLESIEIEE
jgi:hydrogenase nickel incorporation protein HypA/HybF